jgi:hypothetical protein|tara:strand:+ start:162 stop:554 length:393 start_codon:yes stop_codon:yes gene_type:complete
MRLSSKCPACGYSLNKPYDISTELRELLKNRGKKTVRYLNRICGLITTNVPSENRSSYMRFLFALKDIEDQVIDWGIEQFYQAKHFHSGKGFAYLRTMIQNRSKNMGALKKNERAMLGSTPPVIDHEKEK